MPDYFEVDFLDVSNSKSGDAITLRYSLDGKVYIHVVDGGFQNTGERLIQHVNKYYDSPLYIDAVIVTHPDGDHTGGLRSLFDNFEIGQLWMLRPWLYTDELISRFKRFSSPKNLEKRLKEIYPNIAALEELAKKHNTLIYEPFQGARIGEFVVLSPSKQLYLDLVVESEKTPEATKTVSESLSEVIDKLTKGTVSFIRSAWGEEMFPEEDTSPENNMSVIQYAELCEEKILLTGDAGRVALMEAIKYAHQEKIAFPGIDLIQVPHHGSRHNVSSEILDALLGCKLESKQEKFTAIVSAAKEDEEHPRKAVVRAFIHRGAKVIATKGRHIMIGCNAPGRDGWKPAESIPYPEDQEE